METIIGVLVIFGWSALLMFTMSRLNKTGKYNIQEGTSNTPNRVKTILRNQIMSFFLVIGVAFLLDKYVLLQATQSGITVFLNVVFVLLVYDFFYYWMHRFLHQPTLMKQIHGVHHKARKVSAPESLYLHPVENIAGLALLFLMVYMIPTSATAFLIIFACYTTVMILNHTGMVFPHPIFTPLNYMAIKHDHHHSTHLNKNYASMFTFVYDVGFQSDK